MKFKLLSGLKASPIILLLTSSVLGATGAQESGRTMTANEVIERLVMSQANYKELTVKLKNGDSFSGYVADVSRRSFVLREKHGLMLIGYEEVASVQRPKGLRRFLRGIADGAFIGASYALWLPLQGIYYLLTGEGLPDC